MELKFILILLKQLCGDGLLHEEEAEAICRQMKRRKAGWL